MAKKIIAAKQQSRSKTDSKEIAQLASTAANDAMPYLLTLNDIGRELRKISINGWSMSLCLAAVADVAQHRVELMPIPSDRKLGARVKALVKEACANIDAIRGAALMLGDEEYDNGICEHEWAVVVGAGIKSLADKSCSAVDRAAGLLDPEYTASVCDGRELADERAKFGLPAAA